MSKIKLEYEWEPTTTTPFDHKVIIETNADSLPDVLSVFAGFLRAAGYMFEGELVIQEEEYER